MTLNTIIQGDALTTLRTLPDNSVDCCVTSPPYYGLRDYGVPNQIGLEATPEEYIERLRNVFMEVRRLLKPAGTLWLNIGDTYWGGKGYSGSANAQYQHERNKEGKSINREYANIGGKKMIRPTDKKHTLIKAKDLIGAPWMLAFALRNAGWYLRQDIIWSKNNPMPESVKDRCTKAHEYIFLLSKSITYYFNHEEMLEPATGYDGRKNTLYKGGKKDMAGGAHERWPNKMRGFAEKEGTTGLHDNHHGNNIPTYPMRHKRSVWSVNTTPFPDAHFATYPPELITPCIKAGCPENGVVLDPFIGAGTTAIVARKNNIIFIGIELNPKYIKIANKRLRNELGFLL